MRHELILARTEEEVLAEKADALRRIGQTLERQIAELERLREAADDATSDARAACVQKHAALRDRARLQRWYLVVQREAVGLRHHQDLDRHYPIPDPLPT